MSNQKNNMILAFALAALVLFAWQYFVATPAMKAEQARQANLTRQHKIPAGPQGAMIAAPGVPGMAAAGSHLAREAALKAGGLRVAIDTPMVDGSIQLRGAKFDDLRLKKYRETTDPKSPEIVLLAPKSTDYPYYATFGWIGSNVPGDQSVWKQTGGTTLAPGRPVTLTWDNGHGLIFSRIIAVDDKYMFTIADQVTNHGGAPVSLYPYAYVARQGIPKETASFALHLGFVGVAAAAKSMPNMTTSRKTAPRPRP